MLPKVAIPLKPDNPKSRLSCVLSDGERQTLLQLTLEHVVTVLKNAGLQDLDLLSKSPLPETLENSVRISFEAGQNGRTVSVLTDERDLNTALNSYLKNSADCRPILIVMADLALLRPENIQKMIEPICSDNTNDNNENNDNSRFIRIAPGKGGGTNMIYIGAPDVFEVKYHGQSFKKHMEEAKMLTLPMEIYDSFYASVDIDEPDDLTEILIHGEGRLCDFARQILSIQETNGRNKFEHKV
ncbi:Phosphoenolpyruvate guanylyltransferase [Methanosarcinaceae archaeon Ag5]|uniref:2-phospho-L-lactate guanylyltransferase n=1 Tax=Methanolapillus africanus TaxID=3028297 RepID=A0AAE4MJU1_9EURY|nr:Phosphoenolpyruvate guanylyltransferase [Methanosarcinaceae archaeon Ag5]